jgi:outer membrane protein assembly factor BamB
MLGGMLTFHSGQVFAQVVTSWSFPLGGYVYSMPCVGADGTIYVGTQNYGYIYAIDSNGNQKWYLNCDVYATPALSTNGTIYLVYELTSGDWMAAISPSGIPLWYLPQQVNAGYSPAVSLVDGTIFVASATNSILAVNPDGSLKWTSSMAPEYFACSSPVVGADGTIYCGFYNSALSIGRLYAIRPDGSVKWYYQLSNYINTPSIDSTGTIIFGVPTPVNQVYAVKPDGTLKWNVAVAGLSYSSTCLVYSPPVVGVDGTIYISSAARLYALNPSDGSTKWVKDNGDLLAGPEYSNGPVIDTNGVIYYGASGQFGYGSVYAYNPDGSQAWAYSVNSEVECPLTITPDGKILVGATDSLKLIALKGTGSPLANSVWPAARRNISNTASLDNSGVRITTQPQSQIVRAGTNVVFNVVATGLQPLFYQWQKNGANIATATNFSYSILSVPTNASGSYAVVVSNNFSWLVSTSAVLQVIETNKPTIAITAPLSGALVTNATLNIQGTASDNLGFPIWFLAHD